jgi:ADP-heptose:LPS heptosyltransferase
MIPCDAFRRPVVFFANGLGDTLLALPALRALTKLFPERLTLLCDEGVHPALLTELDLMQVVESRMHRNVPDWTREFSFSDAAARVKECDLLISLAPWCSRSLEELMARLRPGTSVGFFDEFQVKVPLNFAQHAADLMFDIPRAFDETLRLEDYAAPPVLDVKFRKIAESIRRSIPPGFRTLVVHADTGRTKMWPANRFLQTLDAFLARHPNFIVLLVGTSPQPIDSGRYAEHAIPCYGLPLGASVTLTGMADLFLGVDSCMLHSADLHRVPAIGLFGASSPLEYGFRFTPASIVIEGESMDCIQVPEVLDALELLCQEV